MKEAKVKRPALAPHVEETIGDLARLHNAHDETTSHGEALIRNVTRRIGRPVFLAAFLASVLAWVFTNTVFAKGSMALDQAPFVYLDLFCTLVSVCLTILILVTQQRDDALAERRDQLTLEMAVISDRKTAKVIALLEELRRDMPIVASRDDKEAHEMASPDKPSSILKAIRESHGETATGVEEPPIASK